MIPLESISILQGTINNLEVNIDWIHKELLSYQKIIENTLTVRRPFIQAKDYPNLVTVLGFVKTFFLPDLWYLLLYFGDFL